MPPTPSAMRWHDAIATFIQERLKAKLDKLAEDDLKRQELLAQHQRDTWMEDAARRVTQIQAVTHSLKPIHPDARGTNLYVEPASLPALQELGSHALGQSFAGDVVGNAAALDVYKFLKVEVDGTSLLAALLAQDPGALQALHEDPQQAMGLRDAFVGLTQPRAGAPSSHTRAKQLYWLTGSDACADEGYELLAPLFATTLAHAVHAQVQEDRFGESNKAARQARRERKAHDGVFHDYPGLAVQKMGGTKPQNISQLNSERGGVNYLLASLPPVWRSSDVRLPVHASSVFDRLFIGRPEVRSTVRKLRAFLATDPEPNLQTRERREAFMDALIDEMVSLAGEVQQTLPAGWSRDVERFGKLVREEQLWLDPLRTELRDEADFAREWLWMDWPAEVGKRFANWLNSQLFGQLPVGDAEARVWKKELLTDEDGFVQQLRELRKRLDAPAYIPIRKTHDELVMHRGGAV
ncbi:CRISPR-associated protein, Csy1 family [Delftia acidovorans SPH-1]|uniref:CRISPR-associated protein, Csy1 family n=4 Tax=Delftia acidovorans TaxID=80866 RepID=A9BUF4_DELAS|nr:MULTISPECIES: type I-F CRISPR-associated protein Csy1 [Delftia]MBA4004365.1 type I-F CRISPR-associated protein Csy1 [Delftia sp.]OLE95859.1 MAG: type I-F CRISPR-associated protein Csy1 [Delftia sp. 13_1_40CM_3_66_6]ABX33857.1 CRISPR-associated protein, Csy1 family [Delftia acidovorans SPH-1]MBN9322933.1 type I-F CRISPR-associated protein Csy1 [Delftia acidovorans]MCP4018626.1 type I-F CRISPR-associated protein Csy1 [Delftia sp.]